MSEELSPESKLYVKEEIEKARKEIEEEVEKAKSKATKTFATIATVVGLLTALGVYRLVGSAIEGELTGAGIAKLERTAEALVADANDSYNKIVEYETDANEIRSKLKRFDQLAAPEGYAWFGDIKFQWGTCRSMSNLSQSFKFEREFPNNCLIVITGLDGWVYSADPNGFEFQPLSGDGDHGKEQNFRYLAIGH